MADVNIKNDDKKSIRDKYIQACNEYEDLIKKDPSLMNGEQIKEHSQKCKAAAEKKKNLAEQFYKLPKSQRFSKPKEVAKGAVK